MSPWTRMRTTKTLKAGSFLFFFSMPADMLCENQAVPQQAVCHILAKLAS